MFDSGFGGLTVARAFIDLLPGEDLVYVGDTGRYPYGPRSLDEVAGYAHEIARHLVDEHDVKLLVVACNTAAAAALASLRDELDVPVMGVIDPGVRSLVRATETGRVGVIGTVGTITSGAYQREVALTGVDVELTPKEFALIEHLSAAPGAAHRRRDILESVWDAHWYGPTKTLDVHMAALRRKLGHGEWIETVRGVGYRFVPPA